MRSSYSQVDRRRVLKSLGAIAGAPFGIAACSSSPSKPAGPVKVTVETAFGTFGRDAYPYVAKAKGYFDEAGVEVTIEPGAPSHTPTDVATGRAQFAAMDFASIVIKTSHDQDLADRLRLVASVNQRSLIAVMALQDGPIITPGGLTGKRVAVATGSVQDVLWPAYAKLAHVGRLAGGGLVRAQAAALPGLLASGHADAIGQFAFGQQTVQSACGGRPIRVLAWSEYLSDLYGLVIAANRQFVSQHPQATRGFVTALMRGLQYTVDHPDEAGQILHTAVPTANPVLAAQEVRLMQSYTTSAGTALGSFDEIRVARAIAGLQAAGAAAQGDIHPDQLIAFDIAPRPIPSGGTR